MCKFFRALKPASLLDLRDLAPQALGTPHRELRIGGLCLQWVGARCIVDPVLIPRWGRKGQAADIVGL